MRVLKIVMKQCEILRSLDAVGYVGSRLGGCVKFIEHAVMTREGIKRVRAPCHSCVLAKLYRASFVLGYPVITSDGLIRFLVLKNRLVQRILREHERDLVSVEELDYREVILTPRQRETLHHMALDGTSITRIARALGVTKPAALKLARRSLRKLALLHTA